MFITLSIVLERMRYEGVVDIFQTVKMLRTQRPAMVQTEVSAAGGAPAASAPPPCLGVLFREMGAHSQPSLWVVVGTSSSTAAGAPQGRNLAF